jgi:hypothetical protein
MFGTIVKDFFTILFVLFLGFIGSFNLFIQNDDDDLQFRIEDIKKYVGALGEEKLEKYEGKLNIFIYDSEDNDFVYLASPFSFLNPGFFFWDDDDCGVIHINTPGINIGIDDEEDIPSIRHRSVRLKEIRNLKSGQILIVADDPEDEDHLMIWRSKKTLPKTLLD